MDKLVGKVIARVFLKAGGKCPAGAHLSKVQDIDEVASTVWDSRSSFGTYGSLSFGLARADGRLPARRMLITRVSGVCDTAGVTSTFTSLRRASKLRNVRYDGFCHPIISHNSGIENRKENWESS